MATPSWPRAPRPPKRATRRTRRASRTAAYVLARADDVAKMMLAKVKQISELLDVPRLRRGPAEREGLVARAAHGAVLGRRREAEEGRRNLETWTWPDGERSQSLCRKLVVR